MLTRVENVCIDRDAVVPSQAKLRIHWTRVIFGIPFDISREIESWDKACKFYKKMKAKEFSK